MEIFRKAIVVLGRVQGVGYRYFARDCASDLGLTGWVMNSRMRTVEIEVQGKKEDIHAFCEKLRRGPPLARVKDLQISEMSVKEHEGDFEITH